jgi:hypothetical protein
MSEVGVWEKLLTNAQSAASSLRVKSALNPMLWLCAIVSLPCFVLAYFFRGIEPLDRYLLYIGAGPIAATLIGFFYFMVRDPTKLQSEEYQIRHEALEVIKQKGSSVEIIPSSLEAIANPVRAITRQGREQ